MDENQIPIDDRVDFVMRRVHDRLVKSTEKSSFEGDADDSFLSSMNKEPSFDNEKSSSIQALQQNVDRMDTSPLKNIENSDRHTNNKTSASKARFSALAHDLEEFECDYDSPCNKPKEAFMRGSPRLSLGECKAGMSRTTSSTSQSRFPTTTSPQKYPLEPEDRRIKFAQPISNVKFIPNESMVSTENSTVLAGSNEVMNKTLSTSSLTISPNRSITRLNTMINTQKPELLTNESMMSVVSTDEYGGHLFMQKKAVEEKTPVKETSLTEICSPKPFTSVKQTAKSFSPVHFTPQNTSSPKVSSPLNKGIRIDAAPPTSITPSTVSAMAAKFDFSSSVKTTGQKPLDMSPAKVAALEGSRAKVMRQQLEERLRSGGDPVTTQRLTMSDMKAATPLGHVVPHARDLFHSANKVNMNPTGGIQTQWRGQQGTPVVQGARAEEKTATNIVGPGQSRLKNLKSRWEFSSATGTPIHPDASEDTILAAAIRMKETALPTTKRPTSKPFQQQNLPSARDSPCAKSPRYADQKDHDKQELQDDGGFVTSPFSRPKTNTPLRQPDIVVEESALSTDESDDDAGSEDASRIIGQAFDFMDRASKAGTPSPYRQTPSPDAPEPAPRKTASLAQEEIIEEETIMEEEEEKKPTQTTAATSSSSGSMPYSVSFYRKLQKERAGAVQIDLKIGAASSTAPPSVMASTQKDDGISAKEKLITTIQVQDEHIKQSTRALALCQATEEFRGSREEVEMQRALLIAKEKKKALIEEYERIGIVSSQGPSGDVVIYMLQFKMSRDVMSSLEHGHHSSELYYFVVLVKSGEQVEASKLTSSDEAAKQNGVIDVPVPLSLRALRPDFRATVEIYAIKTRRERLTHEEKYKLKGSTLKSKAKKTQTTTGGYRYEENFVRCGTFHFDINMPYKKAFQVYEPVFPLEGTAVMKVKRSATEGINVTHHGFLSMYQRNRDGHGLWNRYWCALENGEMKFWRLPEDETAEKGWLVLLDLATCASPSGASIVADTCSTYLNSFYIDVWVPKEGAVVQHNNSTFRQDIEKLRVMLAADTAEDLDSWLFAINESTKQLCTWRNQPV